MIFTDTYEIFMEGWDGMYGDTVIIPDCFRNDRERIMVEHLLPLGKDNLPFNYYEVISDIKYSLYLNRDIGYLYNEDVLAYEVSIVAMRIMRCDVAYNGGVVRRWLPGRKLMILETIDD